MTERGLLLLIVAILAFLCFSASFSTTTWTCTKPDGQRCEQWTRR